MMLLRLEYKVIRRQRVIQPNNISEKFPVQLALTTLTVDWSNPTGIESAGQVNHTDHIVGTGCYEPNNSYFLSVAYTIDAHWWVIVVDPNSSTLPCRCPC